MKYRISLFRNRYDNEPQERQIDWLEFCARVQAPEIRAEKDGRLFSPAVFNGKRAKENVIEVSMLVLDYDSGVTVRDEWDRWGESGYQCALYTTHSHQRPTEAHPEPCDRFRVVIPLLTPCPAELYPRLWQWAAKETGLVIDAAPKDASRMFYTPVKACEDAAYAWRLATGELLDWTLLELPEPERIERSSVISMDSSTPYVQKALEGEASKVLLAGEGARNETLNIAAYNLGTLVGAGAVSKTEAEIVLERAARGAGLDKKEILPTINSGLTAGAANPRTLPERKSPREKAAPLPQTPEEEDDFYGQHIYDIGDGAEAMIAHRDQMQLRCDVTTGWDELDDYYRPLKPAFTIITGQPNAGKSNWLDNLATNLAKMENWRFAVISFETQPVALHQLFIVSFMSGIPYTRITNAEIREWAQKLRGQFIFHAIPEPYRTIDGTLSFLRYTCQRHKIDGVVFDPFTELEIQVSKSHMQTTVIGNGLTRLRAFAYEADVHFWLVIHPSKSPTEARGRQTNRVLTLEDGSGSKNFENKADYGITVHRHNPGESGDYTEVFITKVRRGYPGKRGSVPFDYVPPIGHYEVRTSNNIQARNQNERGW